MRYVIFCLMLLASAATAADADTRSQLGSLLDTFLAGAGSDPAVHERFWAEDLVYTSSDGTRFGKSDILGSLSENEPDADDAPRYSARDVDIRVFDEVATLTFTLVADMGNGEETRFYNSGVFRKHEGQWRAFLWQATRAAD
ncbi:nuclear transport factor 2 family protein [Wenzhouxiangella sp. AB-CW3]|uniref:nuclear transport factor 2 family protein n=1 Tax=Wenzhouxiangella sp. AB-CW3 TaxID=2771012 RepID=UPI00168C0CAF|nr:nuclear transport factor 2 family protein [Wenzhouxiangella sp. AB-CW3]QOC22436.1 nuclear transport factor 2 family protein [Wenzhouxiangella sp. AB-CW3]